MTTQRPCSRALTGALTAFFLALTLIGWVGASSPAEARDRGYTVSGSYVALPAPVRLINKRIDGTRVDVTALGVSGIPRDGTNGVALSVTVSNPATPEGYPDRAQLFMRSNYEAGGGGVGWTAPFKVMEIMQGATAPRSTTISMETFDSLTTNHLSVYTAYGDLNVIVDVVGYYAEKTSEGFVPLRHVALLDTRAGGGAPIAAGDRRVVTVTGGPIPTGATVAYLDVVAAGFTEDGSISAFPTGAAASTPTLRFWKGGGSSSGLVIVKPNAAGQVTFYNRGTSSVHLVIRATGYSIPDAATATRYYPEFDTTSRSYGLTANVEQSIQLSPTTYPRPITAAFVTLEATSVLDTAKSGYLKVRSSSEGPVSTSLLNFTFPKSWEYADSRSTGAVLVPGLDGKINVTWAGAAPPSGSPSTQVILTVRVHGFFVHDDQSVVAGGRPLLSSARTAPGPCFASLGSSSGVTAGCAASGAETSPEGPIYSVLSEGQRFRGPVAIERQSNTSVIVSALHAPDGEVWFWNMTTGYGAATPTLVRSYRHMATPVVTTVLGDGTPMGFAADGAGRVWGIHLGVKAPEQPWWRLLGTPSTGRVAELAAITTPTGAQLVATTPGGRAVSATLGSFTAPTPTWTDLGVGDVAGTPSMGLTATSQVRLAVKRSVAGVADTLWSARLTPVGQVDGTWQPVSTTDAREIKLPDGSPTVMYDPETRLTGVAYHYRVNDTGGALVTWETAPDSGEYAAQASPLYLPTTAIGSDLETWDYRAEDPLTRLWSVFYLDGNGARAGLTQPSTAAAG